MSGTFPVFGVYCKIKEYKKSLPIKEAIDKAVNYAISNNYLNGFFKKHKEGIMYSCLTEFNEEAFRKDIHDEGYNQGYDNGVLDTIQKFIKIMIKNNIPKNIAISELIEEFQMTETEAASFIKKHWK